MRDSAYLEILVAVSGFPVPLEASCPTTRKNAWAYRHMDSHLFVLPEGDRIFC